MPGWFRLAGWPRTGIEIIDIQIEPYSIAKRCKLPALEWENYGTKFNINFRQQLTSILGYFPKKHVIFNQPFAKFLQQSWKFFFEVAPSHRSSGLQSIAAYGYLTAKNANENSKLWHHFCCHSTTYGSARISFVQFLCEDVLFPLPVLRRTAKGSVFFRGYVRKCSHKHTLIFSNCIDTQSFYECWFSRAAPQRIYQQQTRTLCWQRSSICSFKHSFLVLGQGGMHQICVY